MKMVRLLALPTGLFYPQEICACVRVCVCVYVCMYVCMHVAHAVIELNTCENLLSLLVVTFVSNLLIILFKLIISTRIYITIINFVAVCFWLATFRK
jgi:hypothetical protein